MNVDNWNVNAATSSLTTAKAQPSISVFFNASNIADDAKQDVCEMLDTGIEKPDDQVDMNDLPPQSAPAKHQSSTPKEPNYRKSSSKTSKQERTIMKRATKYMENLDERLQQPAFRSENTERLALYREQLTELVAPNQTTSFYSESSHQRMCTNSTNTENAELTFDHFLCHIVQGR